MKPGNLVLVDEATLAGTFALDRLTTQAPRAGTKILLVGDWAQLGAVGAGGAFSVLVEDRETPPELAEVHRFHEPWEKRASTGLRAGSASAIDAHLHHDRVTGGDRDEMLSACYQGWKTDVEAGQSSLMIAQDLGSVTELKRLARADRVAAGQVATEGLALFDGVILNSVGDVVGVSQPRACSGTLLTSVRSPKLPTTAGHGRPVEKPLGWPVSCPQCQPPRTAARASGPRQG